MVSTRPPAAAGETAVKPRSQPNCPGFVSSRTTSANHRWPVGGHDRRHPGKPWFSLPKPRYLPRRHTLPPRMRDRALVLPPAVRHGLGFDGARDTLPVSGDRVIRPLPQRGDGTKTAEFRPEVRHIERRTHAIPRQNIKPWTGHESASPLFSR